MSICPKVPHPGSNQVTRKDLHDSGSPIVLWDYCMERRALTAIPLRAQICAQLFNELRACLITFPIFVRCQRLIARNVANGFLLNRGASH